MGQADVARRAELGAYLRACRAALKPGDVGLRDAPGERRRTPGLRREEVAQLAGVGLAWYTWLEQGRVVSTSTQIIDSLARALQLDTIGHRHLRALANLPLPASGPQPTHEAELSQSLARLVDNLLPNAAYIVDQRFDIHAWNAVYAKLWRNLDDVPVNERNLLWLFFNDPSLRDLVMGWEIRAEALIAQFRAVAGRHVDDPRVADLVARLNQTSPYFQQRWSDYRVGTFVEPRHVIRHRQVGEIQLDLAQLRLVQHPTLTLVLQTPVTDKDKQALLSLLKT